MIEISIQLFQRDLEKLKTEISSYKDEKKLWEVRDDDRQCGGQVKNSAGNLCLHICGNMQYFIGAVLGNSGYERNRNLEFSKNNVPLTVLLKEIDTAMQIVQKTLSELEDEKLNEIFPINVFGYEMTTGFFLTHLTINLCYHLGQINYHRRILEN